jgi:small basic protein
MKDVTSTSFGLLIAFVLPGVAGLYTSSFWSTTVHQWFATFLTAESNVGLFFLLALAALIIGLQLTLVRWLLFERWFSPEVSLAPSEFAALKDDKILAAFRAAVDEHYRYHQFWGGMAVVFPVSAVTAIYQTRSCLSAIVFLCVFLAIEVVTWLAAREAYARYVVRARAILGG